MYFFDNNIQEIKTEVDFYEFERLKYKTQIDLLKSRGGL